MTEAPTASQVPGSARRSFARAIGGLTAANIAVYAAGFATGPILARELGASGRGTYQAIVVAVTLIPSVAALGIGAYASREAARGRSLGELVGSLLPQVLICGAIVAALAHPIARLVGGDQDIVVTWVSIGLWLAPLALVLQLGSALAIGLKRWRTVILTRVLTPVSTLVATVTVALATGLDVSSAAAILVGAMLLSGVPVMRLLSGIRSLRFRRKVMTEGFGFGAKAWGGSIAAMGATRLDQLLMTRLVEPRELGMYAVAVTYSGLSNVVTSALGTALLPRVAQGEVSIVPKTVRVVVAFTSVSGILLAGVAVIGIPLMFGSDFQDAVQMAWILLAATIPLAASGALAVAAEGSGHPGTASLGQLLAIGVTIPGLLILLSPLGGIGAALVSAAAYSANFLFLLFWSRRRLGGAFVDYLLPRRADIDWVRDLRATRRSRSN
jgi:O-antigen/teichoic acid export membrane protein